MGCRQHRGWLGRMVRFGGDASMGRLGYGGNVLGAELTAYGSSEVVCSSYLFEFDNQPQCSYGARQRRVDAITLGVLMPK